MALRWASGALAQPPGLAWRAGLGLTACPQQAGWRSVRALDSAAPEAQALAKCPQAQVWLPQAPGQVLPHLRRCLRAWVLRSRRLHPPFRHRSWERLRSHPVSARRLGAVL